MKKSNKYYQVLFLLLFSIMSVYIHSDEILSQELIEYYNNALNELLEVSKTDPDDIQILREVGKCYFYLGEASHNLGNVCKAIKIFKKILKKYPSDAEIKVYLGSSYTLKARDFPLKWIVSLTPIGFVRIYYVNKGVKLMDDAVKIESSNPLVLIVRALTCTNIPKVFGQFEKGLKDFSLLISWIENPDLCPEYKEILSDESFKVVVYYELAKRMIEAKKLEKAKMLLFKIQEFYKDSPYKKAAKRVLEKI
ncbi:MAG: hypothetical protein N2643_05505 [Endomicrobia bacterium]|nr:hypothetical protein [Endomicrobiia bacterium]